MSRKNNKVAKLPSKTLQYPMRLDQAMVKSGLAFSRSKAEEHIREGYVRVNNVSTTKPGQIVRLTDKVTQRVPEEYVSRAGLKLASVSHKLGLKFNDRIVLDVGSSTGGFTEFALRNGAKKVIAVDVGTDQLHPTLHDNTRIELHEKTDIRDFKPKQKPEIVVMDVSFISSRQILPHLISICGKATDFVIMVKPQFEAGKGQTNKGVIKNENMRREIFKDFEEWTRKYFVIIDKADSEVVGAKGNRERFYLLKITQK